jgi:hypothetical protein
VSFVNDHNIAMADHVGSGLPKAGLDTSDHDRMSMLLSSQPCRPDSDVETWKARGDFLGVLF